MNENKILHDMIIDICSQHGPCDACPMYRHLCSALSFERGNYKPADKEYLINVFAEHGRDLSLLGCLPAEINLAEEECINLFQ